MQNYKTLALGFSLIITLGFQPVAIADIKDTATDLTTLLRSARSVTVNKKTIADPSKINVKKFIKKNQEELSTLSG